MHQISLTVESGAVSVRRAIVTPESPSHPPPSESVKYATAPAAAPHLRLIRDDHDAAVAAAVEALDRRIGGQPLALRGVYTLDFLLDGCPVMVAIDSTHNQIMWKRVTPNTTEAAVRERLWSVLERLDPVPSPSP